MGKVFITDEVNDMYTADVTRGGKIKNEDGAASHHYCLSAEHLLSAESVVASAAWLKNVIIGEYPNSAACLSIIDSASATMGNISAFGTSGTMFVGKIGYRLGGATALTSGATIALDGTAPISIPFNVYCASGIVISRHSAHDSLGRIGCFRNVTVTYQLA